MFKNQKDTEFGCLKLEFSNPNESKTPVIKIIGNGLSYVAIDIKGRVFGFGER